LWCDRRLEILLVDHLVVSTSAVRLNSLLYTLDLSTDGLCPLLHLRGRVDRDFECFRVQALLRERVLAHFQGSCTVCHGGIASLLELVGVLVACVHHGAA